MEKCPVCALQHNSDLFRCCQVIGKWLNIPSSLPEHSCPKISMKTRSTFLQNKHKSDITK